MEQGREEGKRQLPSSYILERASIGLEVIKSNDEKKIDKGKNV